MGHIYSDISLANARDPSLSAVTVSALVDTGALHLCVPEKVALQLKLPELERRVVTVADGRSQEVPYVGPVQIRFANRQCMVGALVLGDQTLLGAIPIEDMDLVVRPARLALEVNPASPNMAMSLAVGITSARGAGR